MKLISQLTRDEIRALTRRSDWHGALAVAGTWAGIAAIFAGAVWLAHPVTFVVAAVLLGGRQHALAVLMHEAAHGRIFRRSWLNEVAGQWLPTMPMRFLPRAHQLLRERGALPPGSAVSGYRAVLNKVSSGT
jgi:fatty acid desaturase